MSQGIWVLVVIVALAVALGGWRMVRDGRFSSRRSTAGVRGPVGAAAVSGLGTMGDRATLLQFSSAFCAPCRATRRVLGEVADLVPGVTHVEVDAEKHLDLVRRLGVVRTPTTVLLDPAGRELSRASGAPHKDEVLATLARVLDA